MSYFLRKKNGITSFHKEDSRDGFDHRQAPADMRKLVVCKETGETMLHKAARLGNEVNTE